MRVKVAVGEERRKMIGQTEFTIAALLSGKSTRVHLKQNPPPGISGAYISDSDSILLFPVLEDLESVTVAVEEAGHSLMREEYLKGATSHKRYLTECAKAGLPNARIWLDWLEDWRVFRTLLKTYPGAASLFQKLFTTKRDISRRNLEYATKHADPVQILISTICVEIAEHYLSNAPTPKTFSHVLRMAREYLRRAKAQMEQEKEDPSQTPQRPQEGEPKPEEGAGEPSADETAQGEDGESTEGADEEDGQEDGKESNEDTDDEPSADEDGEDSPGDEEDEDTEDEDTEETEGEEGSSISEGEDEGEDGNEDGEGEPSDDSRDNEDRETEDGNAGGQDAGLGQGEDDPPPPLMVGVQLSTSGEERAWVDAEPSTITRLWAGKWQTLDTQIVDLRGEE